jgi:3-oxoacyl-[acyl-carrier protein] reductase
MIPIDFGGKAVLVSGGGRGIGRSTALRFAEAGADVGIFDLREEESRETVDCIRSLGRKGFFRRVDVTSEPGVDRGVEELSGELGGIDFFVSSAAITSKQPFPRLSAEVWSRTLGVNLTGPFLCCKAVVPVMIRQGGGRIVLISSGSALTGSGGGAHYASSKGALISLVRTLARELAGHNILANCLAPRNVRTELLEEIYSREQLEKLSAQTPLRRLSTPEEIANVAVFLCSELSTYLTGQLILVDGGRTYAC